MSSSFSLLFYTTLNIRCNSVGVFRANGDFSDAPLVAFYHAWKLINLFAFLSKRQGGILWSPIQYTSTSCCSSFFSHVIQKSLGLIDSKIIISDCVQNSVPAWSATSLGSSCIKTFYERVYKGHSPFSKYQNKISVFCEQNKISG